MGRSRHLSCFLGIRAPHTAYLTRRRLIWKPNYPSGAAVGTHHPVGFFYCTVGATGQALAAIRPSMAAVPALPGIRTCMHAMEGLC